MSEEKTNDVNEVISDTEVKKIEQEIAAKEDANIEKVKKETANQVRKEIETEQKMSELEKQKAELEIKLKEQQEASEKAKAEQEAAINKLVEQRLKEQESQRKSVVPPQNNPFKDEPKKIGDNLSPEKLKEIEEASRIAFEKAFGIKD